MANSIGRKQFTNTVIIHAPLQQVWEVITDSKQMEIWGPPVQKVEVFHDKTTTEQVGTVRKVDVVFGKKKGYFKERRIRQEDFRRIDYQIFEENIGLFNMLKNVGFSMEISEHSLDKVSLDFTFYQDAKGIGFLLHPFIKMQQQKGNKEGLQSLKNYIENQVNQA